MVFENILDYKTLEKKSHLLLIYTIILTSISIFVAYYLFDQNASVVFLFLMTISASHIVYNELREEEIEDEKDPFIDNAFWKRNEKIIKIYCVLFFGCIISVAFWHSILNQSQSDKIFNSQINTIQNIQNTNRNSLNATANSIADKTLFFVIIKNNIIVMTLAFLFSFVFGSGALYIIFWNASVIGIFISQSAAKIGVIG
ncbi:MAG: hypothetical protein B6U87_00610, partial [Candidatus Aenigmarchaeota archaeon ex4484_52]